MTEPSGSQRTVAVRDSDGSLKWFSARDAQRWQGTALGSGELFCAGGRWIHLGEIEATLGIPADVFDNARALEWFTTNGLELPPELSDVAHRRRLGQEDAASD
jgi:hypothetical protein